MPNQPTMLINTLLLAMACALFSVAARASLVGTTVDFTFKETGFSDSIFNNVTVIDPGAELRGDDGNILNGIVQDNIINTSESIDLGVDNIIFTLEGGGPAHSDDAAFQTTGFGADARYVISGFDDTLSNLFALNPGDAFEVSLSNIIGVSLGSELVVDLTLNEISLVIGTLGIGEIIGAPDLGTVTLSVDRADVSVIPLPAALPLMLSALAVIGFVARRKPTV